MLLDRLFDVREILRRIMKYLFQGFIIALVVYLIPRNGVGLDEACLIGACAAVVFCVLDTYFPSLAPPLQLGVGAGIGLELVGAL